MRPGRRRALVRHAAMLVIASLALTICPPVPAAELGLRPIRSVRVGGDFAVPIPLDELLYWGDDFGASVAALGDLDGDGIRDIAVGAPGDELYDSAVVGRVIVLFLESDGAVKAARAIDGSGVGSVTRALAAGDRFGAGVTAIGDLDGDDVGDIVIGAPGDDEAATNAGAIYVVLLEADGAVKSTRKITSGLADFDAALSPGDHFGASIATFPGPPAGSVEIVVGAPDAGGGLGSVFSLVLDSTGAVLAHAEIRADDAAIDTAAAIGTQFGAAVAVPGDIDDNGVADFVVGASRFAGTSGSPDINGPGTVWLLLRNGAGSVQSSVRIGNRSGGFPAELPPRAAFGGSAGHLGDADGNGVPDVIVGAPGDYTVWALLLSADGTIADARRFDRESFFEQQGVALGSAVASIGDLDGNGVSDLAIGGDLPFESFPGTTTTTFFCTTFVTTMSTLTTTTTTMVEATLVHAVSPPTCAAGHPRSLISPTSAHDTTPQRCVRPNGFDICGRPKHRRCGDEHVRVVFLDENADIATCGDGVRDAGEACDDSNTADGDCCTADCLTAPSGNECRFDGNPCAEHRCDGDGACVLSPNDEGHPCVDYFACVASGTCVAGSCVAEGIPRRLCRVSDGTCRSCGQPITGAGEPPAASDALAILQAAVGTAQCLGCVCDVDGNDHIGATDALASLQRAVGLPTLAPDCPHR